MADQDVRHYPHPVIAREGWAFVGLSLFLALAATIVGLESVALLLWIVAIFVIQFFSGSGTYPTAWRGPDYLACRW